MHSTIEEKLLAEIEGRIKERGKKEKQGVGADDSEHRQSGLGTCPLFCLCYQICPEKATPPTQGQMSQTRALGQMGNIRGFSLFSWPRVNLLSRSE